MFWNQWDVKMAARGQCQQSEPGSLALDDAAILHGE